MFCNLTPTPNIALKDQKSAKEAPKVASSTPSLQLINEYLPENVVFITEEAPPGQDATELCLKNTNS